MGVGTVCDYLLVLKTCKFGGTTKGYVPPKFGARLDRQLEVLNFYPPTCCLSLVACTRFLLRQV